jgi:hypothetical protein
VLRVALAWLWILLVIPAGAEESTVAPTDRAAIKGVIERQIAAFAADDAAAAFSFATPFIQNQFGSPERFMRMVREGYQAVYRPRSLSFRETGRVGDTVVQEVDLIGPDGLGARALYFMQRDNDGSWRINGVTLTPDGEKET